MSKRMDIPALQDRHPAVDPESAAPTLGQLPVTLVPVRSLLTYYILRSLLVGPAFMFMLVPLYFRYHTLRYEIDEEGITMRWGILFRREVSLTFARIQDIHVSSNFVERWLGLGKVQIQTASGSAAAEMTIEGIPQYEAMRDFLYGRMRGARDHPPAVGPSATALGAADVDALTRALNSAAAEIRALREQLDASEERC
jgi:putative membrane protein